MSKVRDLPIDAECTKCLAPAGQACACIPRGIGLQHMAADMRKSLRLGIKRCESPIEQLLLAGLLIQTMGHPDFEFLIRPEFPTGLRPERPVVICVPQFKIGPYRADFAILNSRKREMIIVECDGHDFHERTKEQATRDRSRDRWMTTGGYTVLRFTGSEIHNDALAVADEIVEYLERA